MILQRCGFHTLACLFLIFQATLAASQDSSRNVIENGGFENGLSAWKVSGDVTLDKNAPLGKKASVRIGPGRGSVSQRIQVGPDNHLMSSAIIKSEPTGIAKMTVRFLDSNGNEVMILDSETDMKSGAEPQKLSRYMKPHPFTASVEIVISKDSAPGYVIVNNVSLNLYEENDPKLKSTENLAEVMKPLWEGNTVSNEAVLMLAQDGKPASGTLMFKPMRILSVTDYGTTAHYQEGMDFTLDGRTLRCTANSRIPQVKDADLLKGELKWNVVGGKQALVTYEHNDAWTGPVQPYVGGLLPNTMQRLSAHEPLKVVAYGDSITFGIGSSRMLKIPPFQAPWIELFIQKLQQVYSDPSITLYNSSQSGADSNWAKSMTQKMVSSLNPDLVVIAFGQNDFWSVTADEFASNISSVIQTVRQKNPQAEFLLISTMRFDPAYSSKNAYWDVAGQYESRLRSLTGPGVQLVDFTTISGAVFAAKEPKDCLNDPLHPNDYLSRWYAQSAAAALTPAPDQKPALTASPEHTGKKGVGDNDRTSSEVIDASGARWYYNWMPLRSHGDINAQFVPMIWGRENLDAGLESAVQSGAKDLLAFNEPDGHGESDMTVEEAISLWPKLMTTNLRLGSPATTTGAHWIDDFMVAAKAKNLRVDFLCLHWYGDITQPNAVETLRAYLQGYWDRYHLPIWLTEYSGAYFSYHLRKPTVEDNASFAAASGAMLETVPFVERYAWYGTAWTPEEKDYATVGLYNSKTKALTLVGIAYRGIVSH